MLQTLKSLPPTEALVVLSSLTQRLLPSPEAQLAELTDLESAVLSEIHAQLKPRADTPDWQRNRNAQTLLRLTEEIRRLTVDDEQVQSARARLNAEGLLSPAQYRLRIARYFERDWAPRLGIRPSWMIEAMTAPDAVQHLRPFGEEEPVGTSLFLKHSTGARGASMLIVTAERHADELVADRAWRVFPTMFNWGTVSTPLDVLKALVERFGVLFTISGGPPLKFVLRHVAEFDGTRPVTVAGLSQIIEIAPSPNADVLSTFDVKFTETHAYVAMGYAMNVTSYKEELDKPR